MSKMHSLVDYDYSESDEDIEKSADVPYEIKSEIEKTAKKQKLPNALVQLGDIHKRNETLEHLDEPEQHGGRLRSFKHERGNWATHIYVPANVLELQIAQEMCKKKLEHLAELQLCEDLHISLSKTLVLQHHQIESFRQTLQNTFDCLHGPNVSISGYKVYANEQRTRTFVALTVSECYRQQLLKLLAAVDTTVQQYRLETFYENPSFHVSILWCVGDYVKQLCDGLSALSGYYTQDIVVAVDKIICKCGNKKFCFKLKSPSAS